MGPRGRAEGLTFATAVITKGLMAGAVVSGRGGVRGVGVGWGSVSGAEERDSDGALLIAGFV